ncbi:MAG: FG-GAP-like repeat-containing protein, partial [Salibacteraceae bacterium]
MIKRIHQISSFKLAFSLLGIFLMIGSYGYAQIDTNLLNIKWEYAGGHASSAYGLGTQPAGFDTMSFPFAVQNRLGTTTFGDLDNDGDQDFISGNQDGGMYYYQNYGTPTAPQFGRTALPSLDTIRLGVGQNINQIRPELVDIDNDGDFDIFLGSKFPYNGTLGSKLDDIHFFENIGTATTPNFTYNRSKFPNLANQQVAEFANIAAVDIDGDTDLDLVMMGSDSVGYFENVGTLTNPSFQRHYGASNPFDHLAYPSMLISMPDFEDFDGDGDYDMYLGNDGGQFVYFQNKGTATVPVFHDTNLYLLHGMDTADIGQFSHLEFEDINNDGAKDLIATSFSPVHFMWWKGVAAGISISFNTNNITCNGFTNGTAKATLSGATGPVTYAWSTSATTDSIGGLNAGTYILTVTDSTGVTAIDSVIIT